MGKCGFMSRSLTSGIHYRALQCSGPGYSSRTHWQWEYELLKVNYNLLLLIFFLQGDYGGYLSREHIFVTFQKAKLSCSDGKDYPVNFNEIRKWQSSFFSLILWFCYVSCSETFDWEQQAISEWP